MFKTSIEQKESRNKKRNEWSLVFSFIKNLSMQQQNGTLSMTKMLCAIKTRIAYTMCITKHAALLCPFYWGVQKAKDIPADVVTIYKCGELSIKGNKIPLYIVGEPHMITVWPHEKNKWRYNVTKNPKHYSYIKLDNGVYLDPVVVLNK